MEMSTTTTTTMHDELGLLDGRIAAKRNELATLRQELEQSRAHHDGFLRLKEKEMYHGKERLRRLLKRGNDAKLYNQALQAVFSKAMPQQYVLQRQALLLQMLHKTDILTKQMKVIQDISNSTVTRMMFEASVIEKELKVLQKKSTLEQEDFTSQTLKLELEYLATLDAQTARIEELHAIVYPHGLGADPSKFDDLSVGTTDTMQESAGEMTPMTPKSLREVFKESVWSIISG